MRHAQNPMTLLPGPAQQTDWEIGCASGRLGSWQKR
jgi:hypothetical protein